MRTLHEITCACGCNTKFQSLRKKTKYVVGHSRKGKKSSEEHKRKMSEAWSDEMKKIVSYRVKGENNPAHRKEVKEKKKTTCIERYGVDNPSKTESFKKWISENNAMNDPVLREKAFVFSKSEEGRKYHSDRLKDKNHPMHSKEALEKRLKTMAEIKSLGGYRVTNIWKTGWFFKNDGTQEWYDSSYEEIWMNRLEESGIQWTKRHGIKIPYININGINSYYVPDFLLDNKIIEEIKGYIVENSENDKDKNTILKFIAAQKWCSENGYSYKVYVGVDLKLIEKYSYNRPRIC